LSVLRLNKLNLFHNRSLELENNFLIGVDYSHSVSFAGVLMRWDEGKINPSETRLYAWCWETSFVEMIDNFGRVNP